MPLPIALLNDTVTVMRRVSQGRDSLNNPIYGAPTDGIGWNVLYNALPVRLAFSSKTIRFAHEGERIEPVGVMYFNPGYTELFPEDRVITSDGREYNVISSVRAWGLAGNIDHFETLLQLP